MIPPLVGPARASLRLGNVIDATPRVRIDDSARSRYRDQPTQGNGPERRPTIVPFTGRRHFHRMRHSRFPLPGRPCGPRTSRSRSTSSWPARRRATSPGAGALPWTTSSATPGRAGDIGALASLYRAGKVPAVITQNIDNLHQASALRRNTWSSCTATRPMRMPRLRSALRACLGAPADGGGERLRARLPGLRRLHQDRDHLVRSGDAGRSDAARAGSGVVCDLFLAIGSSLLVWPAAGFPLDGQAQRRAACHHQSRVDRVR